MIVPSIDVTPEFLRRFTASLLFIAPSNCVNLLSEHTRSWGDHALNAPLAVLDSTSQALAFAKPEECTTPSRDFLLRHPLSA